MQAAFQSSSGSHSLAVFIDDVATMNWERHFQSCRKLNLITVDIAHRTDLKVGIKKT